MHNWGLAGDINLPLLALFIYLFLTLLFLLLVLQCTTPLIIDILIETNKGIRL